VNALIEKQETDSNSRETLRFEASSLVGSAPALLYNHHRAGTRGGTIQASLWCNNLPRLQQMSY
jgi:hypothetical protein